MKILEFVIGMLGLIGGGLLALGMLLLALIPLGVILWIMFLCLQGIFCGLTGLCEF